jgi:hypothetical protein
VSGPQRAQPPSDPRRTGTRGSALPNLGVIYAGLTSFAVLAGLACYFLLQQAGVAGVLSAILGLAFAFVTRIAAASLAREWLMRAAARERERRRR